MLERSGLCSREARGCTSVEGVSRSALQGRWGGPSQELALKALVGLEARAVLKSVWQGVAHRNLGENEQSEPSPEASKKSDSPPAPKPRRGLLPGWAPMWHQP